MYNFRKQTTIQGNATLTDAANNAEIVAHELYGNTVQNQYSGKNLLQNKVKATATSNGITFTYDAKDGTYTINGKNNGNGNSACFLIRDNLTLLAGTYYTVPMPLANMQIVTYDGTSYKNISTNTINTFTLNQQTTYTYIYIQIPQGTATQFNNVKIYPMISTTAVTENDYEPYTGKIPAPSPDYPQNIEVVTGRQEIQICGENLLNKDNIEPTNNATIIYTNTGFEYTRTAASSSDLFVASYTAKLKPNTTYYIYISKNNRQSMYFYSNALWGTTISYTSLGNVSGQYCWYKFTTTETGKVIIGFYSINEQQNTSGTISNIMMIEGTTKTLQDLQNYKHYKGQILEINLGKNLYEGSQEFSGTWNNSSFWETANETYNDLVVKKRSAAWSGLSKNIILEAGKTYTFSLYAKADASRPVTIYVNPAGSSVFTNPSTKSFNLTTDWQRYYFTFVANSTSVSNIRLESTTGITNSYTYICGYQLEEGDTMTNYAAYFTPIELCKIGDYQDSIKKGTGKNLFDGNYTKAYIGGNSGYQFVVGDAAENTRTAIIKSKPNTTYTVKKYYNTGLGTRLAIYEYPTLLTETTEMGSSSRLYYDSAQTQATVTTGNNGNYLYVYVTSDATSLPNLQIEEGSIATEYEPYGYKDKWYIKKAIGKHIFNSCQSAGVNSSGETSYQSNLGTITDMLSANWGYGISNYFIRGTTKTNNVIRFGVNNTQIYIYTNDSNFADTTTANTWLSTHNTIVYYVLATPIYTLIENKALINQLEAVRYALTYKDITHVIINNNLLPWLVTYQEDSTNFREQSYSGESNYDCHLYINDELIDPEQISKITIKDPIIDTTSQIFYIGSFIAKSLTIKFKNVDNLNIKSGDEIYLEIGQNMSGTYKYVPIGYFYIEDLGENYYTSCEITALDASVKFKQAVDYSGCFHENAEDAPSASIDEILKEVCNACGVPLGRYPSTNGDIQIGTYNNQVSGKQWISYIAELKGCNAKIDRDGYLVLIPLKQPSEVSINASESNSWVLGEEYKIYQVRYYNGSIWYESPIDTENNDNVLYIRTDNPFINSEETIDNIYEVIGGCKFYNLKTENYGDITLDAYDNVTYELDGDNYLTLNDNVITYEMTIMSTVENKIPTNQQEKTTNVILGDVTAQLKTVKTEVDLVNGKITDTLSQVTSLSGNFDNYVPKSTYGTLESRVQTVETSTYTKTEISKIINGTYTDEQGNKVQVSKTVTESGTFSDEGLRIQKEDENGHVISETSGLFNELGVDIRRTNGNTNVFYAGMVGSNNTDYPDYVGQTIVGTQNNIIKNYLVIGKNSRFQDYTDDSNNKGTGCFWIGD